MVPTDITPPSAVLSSQALGEKSATDVLHLSVSLPYRDAAAAERFVDSVSDPKSPNYRHFVTPDQVGEQFGLSDEAVQQVVSYLKSQGMKVKLVGKNHLSILVDGTVAQAQKAFGITIRNYTTPASGKTAADSFYAFSTAPMVPAAIAPYILDISGLESYTRPKARYEFPNQLRQLYNVAPMYNAGQHGENRTVAISNFDGFRLSSLPLFYSNPYFTLQAPAGGVGSNVTVKVVGTAAGPGTQQGEGDLDIQAVLAVAPTCNLVIYDSTSDLVGVLTLEANDNLADIITESWGWSFGSQSTGTACHNLHLSMSAQGITYMAASGDNGTSVASYPYPNYDPEVMMVGGTTVSTDTPGNRTSETGWSGSGGGWYVSTDTFNKLPSWLKGPGIPTNINYRLFPDVALDADPNSGYIVIIGGSYYIFGGTSAASPTFAAGLSISEQKLISVASLPVNGAGKYRFGRIQDLFYTYGGDSTVFYDVTSGANGTLPNGSASNATAGWDMVTGWGAFNFTGFATNYASAMSFASVKVNKPSLNVGINGYGTVLLATAAPVNGLTLTLSSSDPASLAVPTTVTIPGGATSAPFTMTPGGSGGTTVTVTATMNLTGIAKNVSVAVKGPGMISITSPDEQVAGSSTEVCTVTISAPAGVGGLKVHLIANNAAVTVPAFVKVLQGQTTASFSATTNAVASKTAVKVTAFANATNKSVLLAILQPQMSNMLTNPNKVTGGQSSTGTVYIDSPAPVGGLVITLASSDAHAQVPATVTILAGATSANFNITTTTVTVAVNATIKGSRPGSGLTSRLLKIQP